MAPSSTPNTLKIAVLVLPPVQLLDLSPIDIFHMLSKQYLRECNLPQPFVDLGIDDVQIHYVAEHGPSSSFTSSSTTTTATAVSIDTDVNGTSQQDQQQQQQQNQNQTVLAELTARAAIRITQNFNSSVVQPGTLDILLVPGPDPNMETSEAAKAFIRGHAGNANTSVLSVCTGIIPLARAGVLDGRVCTGPRALLGMFLEKDFPRAKWVAKRWVVDSGSIDGGKTHHQGSGKGVKNNNNNDNKKEVGNAELWTAGGITNGQDMVAAYVRAKFQKELADLVCAFADVGDRGQEYGNGNAAEGMWWGWLLFRSWFGGLVGRKR